MLSKWDWACHEKAITLENRVVLNKKVEDGLLS